MTEGHKGQHGLAELEECGGDPCKWCSPCPDLASAQGPAWGRGENPPWCLPKLHLLFLRLLSLLRDNSCNIVLSRGPGPRSIHSGNRVPGGNYHIPLLPLIIIFQNLPGPDFQSGTAHVATVQPSPAALGSASRSVPLADPVSIKSSCPPPSEPIPCQVTCIITAMGQWRELKHPQEIVHQSPTQTASC